MTKAPAKTQNDRSPLLRVALWLITFLVIGGLLQAVLAALGTQVELTKRSGMWFGLILVFALALAYLVDVRRPIAQYGLAVSERFWRHVAQGFAIGAGVAVFVVVTLLATGTKEIRDWSGWTEAAIAVFSAIDVVPGAVMLQLIFGGVALGALLEKHGRAFSVATIGVVVGLADLGIGLLTPEIDPLAAWSLAGTATKVLVIVMLAELRLITGDVVLGAGALIGLFYVARVARKTHIMRPNDDAAMPWLAPGGEAWASPALWAALLLVIGVAGWRLSRMDADTHLRYDVESSKVSASFKRVYPFGTAGALAPLDLWLRELARARFRVGLIYLPRLLATFVLSATNTVLSLPERLLAPYLLRNRSVPDPVFIVGVHRSGTTHLQNLLAKDPQFITPRTYQVFNPAGFKFTGWLILPLVAVFTPWKRPMDAVKYGMDAPNEEEFAIANLSPLSPDWSTRLPELADYYDKYADPDAFTDAERSKFKAIYMHFLQKLTLFNGRRPMLKSPYNTGRVALLREMFPDAKFIHIVRNPVDVYRSNLHLSREAYPLLTMQERPPEEAFAERFLAGYRAMEERYERDVAGLAEDQVAEVFFDDLERDAGGEIERVYTQLGLEFSDRYRKALNDYLAGVAGYKKNRHATLPEEELQQVRTALGPVFERWDQARPAESSPEPEPATAG